MTTMPLPVNGNTLVMCDAHDQTCAKVAQELMANPTLTVVRLQGMRWCCDNPVRSFGRRVSLGVRISTRLSVVEWCAAELRATLGPRTKTCPSYNRRCVPLVHRPPIAMLMQNGTTRCPNSECTAPVAGQMCGRGPSLPVGKAAGVGCVGRDWWPLVNSRVGGAGFWVFRWLKGSGMLSSSVVSSLSVAGQGQRVVSGAEVGPQWRGIVPWDCGPQGFAGG